LTLLRKNRDLKIEYAPGLQGQELNSAIDDASGLIIRTETKITKDLLSHAEKLKVICRAGIGIDHIDLSACKEKHIVVMNTPGANRVSTAEHTHGSLAFRCLARDVGSKNNSLFFKKKISCL